MSYKLLLGPVLGKITADNRIPILIECDKFPTETTTPPEHIRLCVRSDGQEKQYTFEYSDQPKLIYVNLLNNKSTHDIVFENVQCKSKPAECKFNPVNVGTAIVSCDGDGVYHYNTGVKDCAWTSLNNSPITNAIHIGDQVYIDDVYKTSRITDKSSDEEIYNIFTEEIKKVYRKSWFDCEPKRLFLASHV